jgi:hypothetical protein
MGLLGFPEGLALSVTISGTHPHSTMQFNVRG